MKEIPEMICPYCGKAAKLVDDLEIYYRSFGGNLWRCNPCDAHVGCHKGTTKPLGTIANGRLRAWRSLVHDELDPLWLTLKMDRNESYAWLADELGIELQECHVGAFDLDTCKRAVKALQRAYKNKAFGDFQSIQTKAVRVNPVQESELISQLDNI